MADAVFWQLLERIQSGLQDDLSFVSQGDDGIRAIADEAIVIRKLDDSDATQGGGHGTENLPGILITLPRSIVCPPDEGTNERDDVHYQVLIQIIDADQRTKTGGLETYLKWQEMIRKYFNQSNLGGDLLNEEGMINQVLCEQVNVVDEKQWVRHALFRAGVIVRAISREPRGITS